MVQLCHEFLDNLSLFHLVLVGVIRATKFSWIFVCGVKKGQDLNVSLQEGSQAFYMVAQSSTSKNRNCQNSSELFSKMTQHHSDKASHMPVQIKRRGNMFHLLGGIEFAHRIAGIEDGHLFNLKATILVQEH